MVAVLWRSSGLVLGYQDVSERGGFGWPRREGKPEALKSRGNVLPEQPHQTFFFFVFFYYFALGKDTRSR